MITHRLNAYIRLMRLDKPIGIGLLLWPTLMALWVASFGKPDLTVVAVFVLGVVVMRSAGCVMNDLADKQFDQRVARTQNRPLTSREVSSREATVLILTLLLLALCLLIPLNPLTRAMSVIGLLLASIYPFMKRYTHFPQVVLGMAFGWAVPMAFTALRGEIPLEGWLLYLITGIWAVIYDTEYAMVDREDDLKIGIQSTAILFGTADRFIIGVLQGLMLMLLALLGYWLKLGTLFFLGLGSSSVFFLRQQYLLRDRKPELCFKAFLNNNWFGAWVFLFVWLDYYLK